MIQTENESRFEIGGGNLKKNKNRNRKEKVTEQIDAVVKCTPIRVNNNSKLTNLMKLIRIEG